MFLFPDVSSVFSFPNIHKWQVGFQILTRLGRKRAYNIYNVLSLIPNKWEYVQVYLTFSLCRRSLRRAVSKRARGLNQQPRRILGGNCRKHRLDKAMDQSARRHKFTTHKMVHTSISQWISYVLLYGLNIPNFVAYQPRPPTSKQTIDIQLLP